MARINQNILLKIGFHREARILNYALCALENLSLMRCNDCKIC